MKNLSLLSTLYILLHFTTAHFSLTTLSSLGLTMDNEDTSPCGGFSFSSSSTLSDFHVSGDAVGVKTTHPQANILIRGTLDTTASGNWTNLFPIVGQYGLGNFCEPKVAAPAEWVGKKGLVQVVESSVDGLLFQCAAVNFVDGSATVDSSTCTNGTGVTGSFTSDDKLPSSGQSLGTGTSTLTSTSTSASSSTLSSISAAPVSTSSTPSSGEALKAKGAVMGLAIVLVVAVLR